MGTISPKILFIEESANQMQRPSRSKTKMLRSSTKSIHLFLLLAGLIVHSNAQCEWRGNAPFCDPSGCHVDEYKVDEDGPSSEKPKFGHTCWYGTKKLCYKLQSCYFNGNAPFCSPSSCRDGDTQIGTSEVGDGHKCVFGTKKFCCPGLPNRHVEATLYENVDHRGSSRSYDEDSDCINVKQESIVRSIDTHNTCVRAYGRNGCQGNSISVTPGSPFHHDLRELRFHDALKSIGPCLANDHNRAALIKRSWEPRFLDDVVTFGYNDSLQVDTRNLQGPVHFYQIGYGGRTEVMVAVITRRHICSGSATTAWSRRYIGGFDDTNYHDDAGHVLGSLLGGSGTDPRNLFPQNRNFNRGVFAQFEGMVADIVVLHGRATYSVNLQYQGYATRPNRIFVRLEYVDRYTRETRVFPDDFLNP